MLPALFCLRWARRRGAFRQRRLAVEALSIHPKVTLHVFKRAGFTSPEPSRGEIDPFAQHDDGER